MTLRAWRLFGIPIQRLTVRSTGSLASESIIPQPHLYKKTYTKDELVVHLTDNVVYESSDYIATSVPQGIKFLNKDRWNDSDREVVCDTSLQDMLPDLCNAFKSKYIFVTKQPRRNSSGLLLLSKNFKAFQYLRRHFTVAQDNLTRIYTYLAVVVGFPNKEINKTFRVEQLYEEGNLVTEILEEYHMETFKAVKTKYEHRVIQSTEEVSLIKISVSYDLRDCIRHILSQRCFTPVFGDSWCAKRAVGTLFGAPLACSPGAVNVGPYELDPEILKKLHLSKDEQKYIPIHIHLYGVKLSLKDKAEFFVSVPPPESFVWTCKRLGLHEIQQFAPNSVLK